MNEELQNLLDLVRGDPSPRNYSKLIENYRQGEDYENAVKYADECLEEFPGDLKTMLVKGKVLIEAAQLEDAEAVFLKILENKPTHYMANQQIARVYKEMGNLSDALKHLEVIYEENPDDELVEEELKELRAKVSKKGDEPEKSSDAEIYTVANARLYEEKGEEDKAKELLEKILSNDADNEEAKDMLRHLESPEDEGDEAEGEDVEDKFSDLFDEGDEPEEVAAADGGFDDIFGSDEAPKEKQAASEEGDFGDIFEEEASDDVKDQDDTETDSGDKDADGKGDEAFDDIFGADPESSDDSEEDVFSSTP
ncbi:tetratricopeptide repeat protein, partial [bacterium]|nr:tetratricopeptide repeat protein [bacterium]